MSDPVLHIKDSYYFEVPKVLAPAHYRDKAEFPDVWVKNDDQFQQWEAERFYHLVAPLAAGKGISLPDEHTLLHDWHHWHHWQHAGAKHENFAKPLDLYIETFARRYERAYANLPPNTRGTYDDYLAAQGKLGAENVVFARLLKALPTADWSAAKKQAGGREAIGEFKSDSAAKWSEQKIAAYNDRLSGKLLIPQPFAELRNMYETESGFGISKLLLLEVLAGVLMFAIFTAIASRLKSGAPPKGRFWNFAEVFLLFIRDQIARPALGANHDEHEHEHENGHEHEPAHHAVTGVAEGRGEGGAGLGGPPVEVSDIHSKQHTDRAHSVGKNGAGHVHRPYADADRFVPLLWTIFFFVLFCNLFGLVPWLGGPTAAFGVTVGLAMCTFVAVVVAGSMKFGVIGFFTNQVPSMDLPLPLAIVLKPGIFLIEIMGLLVKHLILSVRLLANMVAGHLVILGIMALAFGAEAAVTFSSPDTPGWLWYLVAVVSVVSSATFSLLELFVAFLQAYIFTFLSALFIGASVHKH